MNAKKIMGAVLVALLAAALFVGAGAAAGAGAPAGITTVFVYQDTDYTGNWVSEDGLSMITFDANGVIKGDNIKEGIYIGATDADKIYVCYPTGEVSANIVGNPESILGGTVSSDETVVFAAAPAVSMPYGLIFTSPSGYKTTAFGGATWDSISSTQNADLTKVDEVGEWKVQVYFAAAKESQDLDASTPAQFLLGSQVYSFTIADTTKKITLSADTVIKGNVFSATISGVPGTEVSLTTGDKVDIIAGQPNVAITDNDNMDEATVTIGANGQTVVALKAVVDGKATITAYADKTAKVTIEKGTITAEAGADFYYLGNDVTISGTNTESGKVWFYIKGSNIDLYDLQVTADVKADKTWSEDIAGALFDNFDAGTYTIYAVAQNLTKEDGTLDKLNDYTYASVSVALKQPFLTAELSSTTVAQGSELTITGTAEAANKGLLIYVFGNNKFAFVKDVPVEDDGTYEYDLKIDAGNYATGQYFVVVQHPMYNEQFNIAPLPAGEDKVGQKKSFNIVLNTTADVFEAQDGSILFNTLERQSSNAAEALCQALDTQNIDDIYVKASFVVAQPTATINPVSDVAKGAKLVVSGTSNMAPGTVVTVEMLSTAFAAIPKESVNSASFITLTTKVQDDGTWEVTFDTTGLNVDEYTLGATVGDIKTSTTVVKVLESAPVTPEQPDTPDVPDTPDTPDTPDVPETPGFGALAALAGLGAVAVLLLRRE